ncbi:MAG: hypothetical protein NTW90_04470 [Nitrosospira sp.]|nr:hypothetical protein [Nitrosospira sp.]
MSNLTANDLKTKGVAAIEAVLAERPEAIVSVRGKDRFVVMEIAHITICASANWKRHWPKHVPISRRGALCKSRQRRMSSG